MTKLAFLLIAAAATACAASTAAPGKGDDNRPLGTVRWSIDKLDDRQDNRVQLSLRTGDGVPKRMSETIVAIRDPPQPLAKLVRNACSSTLR